MISAFFTSCIDVVSVNVDVASVTLDETALTLNVDDERTLVATVLPENATDKTISWSSSNNSVVSVSEGVIKALKVGSAIITASAQGKTGSCTITVNPKHEIYVAGMEFNANNKMVAKLWKDGVATNLTDGTHDAEAVSVYVSGDDVYVAGYESNGEKFVAKLWKISNNIVYPTSLSDGTRTAEAKSVFVSGNDIYVVGYEEYGTLKAARLWTITSDVVTPLILTPTSTHGEALSVFVSGTNLYIAGRTKSTGKWRATVWDNISPIETYLSDGSNDSAAHSIFVSGSDVYVTGFCDGNATVWKNRAATTINSGDLLYSQDKSICVAGTDVYAVGTTETDKNWVSWLSKNGIVTTLPTGFSAVSCSVLGTNVYAVGNVKSGDNVVASIWTNSTVTSLADIGHDSCAYSIFVK